MTHRYTFQPPPPPEAPIVSQLRIQRAERGIKARSRWMLAGSGSIMAWFGWAGMWVFVLPADAGLLACVALPGLLCLSGAVVYFNLSIADEVMRFVFNLLSHKQELDLRRDSVYAGIEALDKYGHRWYRIPETKKKPPPTVNNWQEADQKARVQASMSLNGSQQPVGADTQRLPELPPPLPYSGSPERAIVSALVAGADCNERMRPGGLSKPAYQVAVKRLADAGVVVSKDRRPLGFSAYFARMGEDDDLLHAETARVLGMRTE